MKFAMGEIVIVAITPGAKSSDAGYSLNQQVEIVSIPGQAYCPCCNKPKAYENGYSVKIVGAVCIGALEEFLRKLPGNSIPASTLAIFAKKQPNPDKVKETERG